MRFGKDYRGDAPVHQDWRLLVWRLLLAGLGAAMQLGLEGVYAFGPLLALMIYVRFPRFGFLLYGALFAQSLFGDLTRLQPQLLSLFFLLPSGFSRRSGLVIGRIHLSILWFYAGLWKLLAGAAYFGSDFLPRTLLAAFDPQAVGLFGAPVHAQPPAFFWINLMPVVLELVIGTAALFVLVYELPILRRIVRTMAPILHCGVVLALVLADWNHSVWVWNLLLALAAGLLFASPQEQAPWSLRLLFVFLFGVPWLYQWGLIDAYSAHHLYTNATPHAQICKPGAGCRPFGPTRLAEAAGAPATTRAPLPPLPGLFYDRFARVCQRGDWLLLHETRPLMHARFGKERRFLCPPNGRRVDRTGRSP